MAFFPLFLSPGSDHEVVLWDSRTQHRVGCLKRKHLLRQPSALPKVPSATADSSPPAAAAAAAELQTGGDDDPAVAAAAAAAAASKDDESSSSSSSGGGVGSSSGLDPLLGGCCGVQLDEWKLAVGGAVASAQPMVGWDVLNCVMQVLRICAYHKVSPIAEQLPLIELSAAAKSTQRHARTPHTHAHKHTRVPQVGFGSTISLHDIRTAGAAFGGTSYREPFLTLHAPSKM
eukprot:233877-Pelagomonas_calceolata.AAC.1